MTGDETLLAGRRIDTPRLVLRPTPLATARALLAGLPVPGLVAGPGWPQPDTLDALALDVAAGSEDRTGWLITLRSTGEVIGDCGWRGGPDPAGDAEIGYGLAAPFRGQGYGSEAVQAMVRWCLRRPGVRRLVAEVLPGNVPSRRVLLAAGFTEVDSAADHLLYARSGQDVGPPQAGT